MSKLANILLLTIFIFLILIAYLLGTNKIFMVGIALILSMPRLNRLVKQFERDRKIKRMGDYFTAYKIAEDFGETEATVEIWCEQGRVPGAFKAENLWLIPRDITIKDIDLSTGDYRY